jgi:transposase
MYMALKGSKERVYPGTFKQAVVEDKMHTGNSFRCIGKKYNIPHSLVINWCNKYAQYGVESLYIDKRGAPGVKKAPRKTTAEYKRSREATIRQLDAKLDSLSSAYLNSDERTELEYLRMENAYLKKLRALVQE